mmetsp:Transcript_10044/g.41433  ORF Transcript_10044/g.41433 Transcript_10044/m.41433 type:complete len:231 (+) Transcript_10044:1609-2301(+)
MNARGVRVRLPLRSRGTVRAVAASRIAGLRSVVVRVRAVRVRAIPVFHPGLDPILQRRAAELRDELVREILAVRLARRARRDGCALLRRVVVRRGVVALHDLVHEQQRARQRLAKIGKEVLRKRRVVAARRRLLHERLLHLPGANLPLHPLRGEPRELPASARVPPPRDALLARVGVGTPVVVLVPILPVLLASRVRRLVPGQRLGGQRVVLRDVRVRVHVLPGGRGAGG